MSGRASLDLIDELLSGVITMEYVSGTKLRGGQWSAVECNGMFWLSSSRSMQKLEVVASLGLVRSAPLVAMGRWGGTHHSDICTTSDGKGKGRPTLFVSFCNSLHSSPSAIQTTFYLELQTSVEYFYFYSKYEYSDPPPLSTLSTRCEDAQLAQRSSSC